MSRTIRLVRPLDSEGLGVFSIQTGRQIQFYVMHEIPSDIGGRGFAVHRLGLGTLYHVLIGKREECSCECMGFLSRGKCKHISGLLALAGHGLI